MNYSTSYHALAVPAASESLTLWQCDSPQQLHLSQSLRHCSDLEHPNRHILSTPIAILCIFVSKFIHEFTLCHIWINVLIHMWIRIRIQKNCCHIWWIHLWIHIWEFEEFVLKPLLVYMFFSWIHIQIHDFPWIHIWIDCINSGANLYRYTQNHGFSWIHAGYHGFWPFFLGEIIFKIMSEEYREGNREKYREYMKF